MRSYLIPPGKIKWPQGWGILTAHWPKDRIFLRNNLEKLQITHQEESLPPAWGPLSIIIIESFRNLSSPMLKFFKITIPLFLFLPGIPVLAAEPLDAVINEIAWMGTENSASDEWIEIYNNSSFDLSLNGWQLTTEDKALVINLEGNLRKGDFFLIERTDDQTLPDVKADLIYKGSLNNKGEFLKLIAKDGNVIDEVNCSSGWFAGENETKKTMERKNPLVQGNNLQNWQTSQNLGGTPKTKNSRVEEAIILENEVLSTNLEKKDINYPSGVFINEFLPSPEGPDDQNEWIEIFNQNDFEINLSGWGIKDSSGKITTYIFPEKTTAEAKGFLVFYRPVTKIILNNEGDKLMLFWPNGKIADEVSYENSPRGQSLSRNNSDWHWSGNLTPGSVNVISSPEENKKGESQEKSEKPEPSSEIQMKRLKATIDEQFPKNRFLVIFIALTTALFSGIIILILRKHLTQRG